MDTFVVDTPLQMLNAFEARQRFEVESPQMLVLLWPSSRQNIFETVARLQNWGHVRYFRMFPTRGWQTALAHSRIGALQTLWRALLRFRLQRALRAMQGARRLFVGNYRNGYMRHCAAMVRAKQLILLDDGTDSLVFARELRSLETSSKGNAATSTPPAALRSRIRQRFIDWNETIAPALTFFSSYPLKLRTTDTLIRHGFDSLRGSFSAAVKGQEIYVLGQPLVADGYLSASDYTTYLRLIRAHYGDSPIAYIPHPREAGPVADHAAQTLSARLLRLDTPVELHLLTLQTRPRRVGSFFCSALDNCRQLFVDTMGLDAFVLESSDLLCCQESTAEVYRYLDSAGVLVHRIRVGADVLSTPAVSGSAA